MHGVGRYPAAEMQEPRVGRPRQRPVHGSRGAAAGATRPDHETADAIPWARDSRGRGEARRARAADLVPDMKLFTRNSIYKTYLSI